MGHMASLSKGFSFMDAKQCFRRHRSSCVGLGFDPHISIGSLLEFTANATLKLNVYIIVDVTWVEEAP